MNPTLAEQKTTRLREALSKGCFGCSVDTISRGFATGDWRHANECVSQNSEYNSAYWYGYIAARDAWVAWVAEREAHAQALEDARTIAEIQADAIRKAIAEGIREGFRGETPRVGST
jgi:hypothetical protein